MTARQITAGQLIGRPYCQRARKLRREMTPAERLLWGALRNHRLAGLHFRRQQIIGCYIVDFCCLDAGVVVEVDGEIHLKQRRYDTYRDEYLASHDLVILRFSNDQIFTDLASILREISLTCQQRKNRCPPPA